MRILLSLLVLLLLAVGCVPRAVINIDADDSAAVLPPPPDDSGLGLAPYGRIGIIDADMYLYDVSAGGIFEFRDDWSRAASKQAMLSAALTLKKKDFSSIILPDFPQSLDFYRLKTELRYHSTAFQSNFFAAKKTAYGNNQILSYSISPIDSLCDRYGVEGFLYIYGFGEKFSDERRHFLFVSQFAQPNMPLPDERTFIAVILARRDGRLLWYKHVLTHGDHDMRQEAHSMKIVEELFE
jgi:hypothetical protein